MKRIIHSILTCFISFLYISTRAQLTATCVQPVPANSATGSITVNGLTAGSYTISYKRDGVITNITPAVTIAAAATTYTLTGLTNGVYSDITFRSPVQTFVVPDIDTLSRVAVQSTKFFGAVYQNFTGVPDDDPSNFTQVYAMLSQPLRKIYGINSDAKGSKRFILLRNLFFQLTYGNTDKFKLYSYDTLNTKYVNKLDLLAHAYLNAQMSFNLITFIAPQSTSPANGDLVHLYLNATLGFLSTNVTELLLKDSSVTKTSAEHCITAGADITAKFNDIFNSKFQVQLGVKAFSIYAASSVFDPFMNPQSGTIPYISNAQNTSKTFERPGNPLYYNLDAKVSYNFTKKPGDNSSNLFLHFSSTTDLARASGKNYSNNYFQFQTGIVLDIPKLFGGN